MKSSILLNQFRKCGLLLAIALVTIGLANAQVVTTVTPIVNPVVTPVVNPVVNPVVKSRGKPGC